MNTEDKEAFDARMRAKRRNGTDDPVMSDDMARDALEIYDRACKLVATAEALGFRLTITRVPLQPLAMGRALGHVEVWRHGADEFPAIGSDSLEG